ncbi:hypothetical protein B7463_g116, partial [Scytalidium lignicola]
MPPKRKAPLATADANAIVAPAAKKVTKGKDMARVGPSAAAAAAAAKKYKYSDPSSFANQGPVECAFLMWPSRDDEDDESDTDEDDDEEDKAVPGSLLDILNGLANEKAKAVHEALNPPHERAEGCRSISVEEIRRRVDETSKPFQEKMDEARQKFVTAGTMTAEEAKVTVGQDDETRKRKRKAKKGLQKALNKVQEERNKAVRLALDHDGTNTMAVEEEQRRIAEASKPFEEKMEKVRGTFVFGEMLTEEEAKAILPNIGDNVGDGDGEKKDKDAEKEDSVPPRVVTDKGFPVTKAGLEKFFEINQEIDKRDQDAHDMYIYNDFSGYGVIEVLENTLAEFNKLIFKKEVSPLKKWAIVEALTTYLEMGDHMVLMMSDNSEGIGEIFDMMGVMFITALEMLHESGLIGPISPLPDNVGLMTLFFLDFMTNTATDFDIEWTHEIVRSADMYGVVLSPLKQVEGVDQETLDDLRERCEDEKRGKGFAWKTEYPKFKRSHPGGHHYDINKMPQKEKARYTFGTKEYKADMMMGDDSDEMSGDSDYD